MAYVSQELLKEYVEKGTLKAVNLIPMYHDDGSLIFISCQVVHRSGFNALLKHSRDEIPRRFKTFDSADKLLRKLGVFRYTVDSTMKAPDLLEGLR